MRAAARGRFGNLPAEVSSFVGRERELDEVQRLLTESRLVTLTGVGGSGKTRLALRAAERQRRAFPGGVAFVDLTQIHEPGQLVADPELLARLVLAALGQREPPGDIPPWQQLVRRLADGQALLVVDNCDHLIPACAGLLDSLLRACDQLRVLSTSRQPLAIAGETLFEVPPMPIPADGTDLAGLDRLESVALFVTRAQAVVPGFELTEENRAAVAELCRRLDGLPLAIELAAARVRVLAPAQILDRLADRFGLLSLGGRTATGRQRTLRACVDWSFESCTNPERVLWARLSVFAGGFAMDAVEAVCAGEPLAAADMPDLVAGLVDKSILIRQEVPARHGTQIRFRMLETLRDYGRGNLAGSGDLPQLRRRHRDWCLQLVTRARAEWGGDRQSYWLIRLDREHHNLRAAVETCLGDPDQARTALDLVVTLPRAYWVTRGTFGEVRHWLDRALARSPEPTVSRARALVLGCHLALLLGDAVTANRLLAQEHDLARRLGTPNELAADLFLHGVAASMRDDPQNAARSFERGLAILATTSARLPAPDPDIDLHLSLLLGVVVFGDRERAAAAYLQIEAMTPARGESIYRSWALWALAMQAWRGGRLEEAARYTQASLRIMGAEGHDDLFQGYDAVLCLEALAWIAAAQRRYRRAATLLGAVETRFREFGTSISTAQYLVGDHDTCERQTRDALGDVAFAAASDHGRTLGYADAIAYGLEERPGRSGQRSTRRIASGFAADAVSPAGSLAAAGTRTSRSRSPA